MRRGLTRMIAVSAVVLGLVTGVQAQMQMHQPQQPQAKPAAEMSAKCKAMMAGHEKMMADTNVADARLDALVAQMNAASGEAKAVAAAAAVTELVAQRKAMRDGMMGMHQKMMGHTMEHMQAGKASMAMCPMMKKDGMKH